MMQLDDCTFCGKKAIYLRSYSGERYCERCYVKAVEKKVQRTISRTRMLKPNDKLALALSGGKDSISLLHIMSKLEEKFPQSEIVAITIDEGIKNYRSEAIEIAKENCNELDVEHHVYSFRKLYGYTLDEIADVAKHKGKPFVCSYCGILRRKALNIAARDVKATKLATGHNLDDEIQSMMMSLFRGDIARMSIKKHALNGNRGLVPRVKPLCEIPEKDVALYAFMEKMRFQSLACGYLETSLRSDVRRFLNMLEGKHSGMKFTINRSFEKVRSFLKFSEKKNLKWCRICSEPTTREICMACQTLKDLDLVQ